MKIRMDYSETGEPWQKALILWELGHERQKWIEESFESIKLRIYPQILSKKHQTTAKPKNTEKDNAKTS